MCYNKEHKAEHGYNMNVYNSPSTVLPSLINVQQSISSLTPHVYTSLISMYNNSHTPTLSLSLFSTSFTHSELRLHTRQSVHPWLCDKQTVLFCVYVSGCARLKPRYLVEKNKMIDIDEHGDLWHTTSLVEAKHRVTRDESVFVSVCLATTERQFYVRQHHIHVPLHKHKWLFTWVISVRFCPSPLRDVSENNSQYFHTQTPDVPTLYKLSTHTYTLTHAQRTYSHAHIHSIASGWSMNVWLHQEIVLHIFIMTFSTSVSVTINSTGVVNPVPIHVIGGHAVAPGCGGVQFAVLVTGRTAPSGLKWWVSTGVLVSHVWREPHIVWIATFSHLAARRAVWLEGAREGGQRGVEVEGSVHGRAGRERGEGRVAVTASCTVAWREGTVRTAASPDVVHAAAAGGLLVTAVTAVPSCRLRGTGAVEVVCSVAGLRMEQGRLQGADQRLWYRHLLLT